MKMRLFQKGFNYSQDGQGNRLVYHLQGCNMRCPWCSNPEGIAAESRGSVEYEINELVDEALRSVPMFFDGGGVTLTGGEASLQFEASFALLSRLREAGVHTALETNGSHLRLDDLFPVIDELIADVKHYDPAVHRAHIGVGNEQTILNIEKAKEKRDQLLVRIPLVNGFNASKADMEGFIRLLRPLDFPGLAVELLPYHEFGRDKWEKSGMPYQVEKGFVSGEAVAQYKARFRESGFRIRET